MQDPPPSVLPTKDYGAARKPLRITEMEGDQHEPRTQRLDAQVLRDEPVVGRPAARVGADIRENGAEGGVDAAPPPEAISQNRCPMKNRR